MSRMTTSMLVVSVAIAAGALVLYLTLALAAVPSGVSAWRSDHAKVQQAGEPVPSGSEGMRWAARNLCISADAQPTVRLNAAALSQQVQLLALSVGPAAPSAGGLWIAPVSFGASGSPDRVQAFLAEVAKDLPSLFFDKVQLTSSGSAVTLGVHGRVVCAGA